MTEACYIRLGNMLHVTSEVLHCTEYAEASHIQLSY
jgi:hypothetical protein